MIYYIEIILSDVWVVNICLYCTIFRRKIVFKYFSVLIVVRFSYARLKCFCGQHSQLRSGRVPYRTLWNTWRYCFRKSEKTPKKGEWGENFPIYWWGIMHGCCSQGRGKGGALSSGTQVCDALTQNGHFSVKWPKIIQFYTQNHQNSSTNTSKIYVLHFRDFLSLILHQESYI